MSDFALDKSLEMDVAENFGSIGIRVVVLNNKSQSVSTAEESEVLDLDPDEIIDEGTPKRPIDGYLESPKRGKYCCVFFGKRATATRMGQHVHHSRSGVKVPPESHDGDC